MSSDASAESPRSLSPRGALHVRKDGSEHITAAPHTAIEASANFQEGGDLKEFDGEHAKERMRVLAVKLDLHDKWPLFQRLTELSWQAARYRNLFLRALWAEAKHLCVDPKKNIPHDVTKWIRHDEKMELSGHAYAPAENEVRAIWKRHAKRIFAGAPLPEWKPTAALSIRHEGIRLSKDGERYTAELAVQSEKCQGGCWLSVPIASGAVKDWHAPLLDRMADGEA